MSAALCFAQQLQQWSSGIEHSAAHALECARSVAHCGDSTTATTTPSAADRPSQQSVWMQLRAQAEQAKRDAQQLLDACNAGAAAAAAASQPAPSATALVQLVQRELAAMRSHSAALQRQLAQAQEAAAVAANAASHASLKAASSPSPARASVDENSAIAANSGSAAKASNARPATASTSTKAKLLTKVAVGSASKPPRPASATTPAKSSGGVRPRVSVVPAQPSRISPAKLAQSHRRLSSERQKQAAAAAAALAAQQQSLLESTAEEAAADEQDDESFGLDDSHSVPALECLDDIVVRREDGDDDEDGNVSRTHAPSTPAQPTKPSLLESVQRTHMDKHVTHSPGCCGSCCCCCCCYPCQTLTIPFLCVHVIGVFLHLLVLLPRRISLRVPCPRRRDDCWNRAAQTSSPPPPPRRFRRAQQRRQQQWRR